MPSYIRSTSCVPSSTVFFNSIAISCVRARKHASVYVAPDFGSDQAGGITSTCKLRLFEGQVLRARAPHIELEEIELVLIVLIVQCLDHPQRQLIPGKVAVDRLDPTIVAIVENGRRGAAAVHHYDDRQAFVRIRQHAVNRDGVAVHNLQRPRRMIHIGWGVALLCAEADTGVASGVRACERAES
eukprot:7380871-Prymnesium_polylepis.3